MSRIKEIDLNEDYLIGRNKSELDFWDVFHLDSNKLKEVPELKDLMIAFFKSFPKSFMILLHTREKIAKRLNLKTAPENDPSNRLEILHNFKGNIGESVAIFEVLAKSDMELMTGQKDTHLDFKLSFISYKNEKGVVLEMATSVILNNTLGKFYFSIVKPIHKFYMRRILKKMETVLVDKDW